MALTQISTQGIKDGTITGTDLATNVDLVDNQKLRLGTGSDFEIYHNGFTSIIGSASHTLGYYSGVNHHFLNADGTETLAKFTTNGSAELYYDNSKKLETTSTGVTVTGALAATSLSATGGITGTGGNFILGDSSGTSDDRIKLGASQDLQIYHDGSNSYVENTNDSGDLYIKSIDARLISHENEEMVKAVGNGAVELYYDGSKKFETTSTGVALTGNLELAGAGGNVSTNWDNAAWEKVIFDASYNTNPQGPNKIVLQNDTSWKAGFGISSNEVGMYSGGNIVLYSKTTDSTASTKETLAKFIADGAVELYYDNSKKFETNANGTHHAGTIHTIVGDFYPSNDNAERLGLSNRRLVTSKWI